MERAVIAEERQADRLAVLAGLGAHRNNLHRESIVMQREGLDLARRNSDLQAGLAEPIHSPAFHVASDESVGADVPEAPAKSEPQLFAILRDPATAPAGWVTQVKKTYDGQADALREASRLARTHGGRFLVLQVVSYAEAKTRIYGGAPDPADTLADLPF